MLSKKQIKEHLKIVEFAMGKATTVKRYQKLWNKWISLFNQLIELEKNDERCRA